MFFGYLLDGILYLRNALLVGIGLYALFFVVLYATKKRQKVTWQCLPELLFTVYGVAALRITGIWGMSFHLDGWKNFNLIPFVDGSLMMVFLNLLLFVPLGLLLPIVFRSYRENGKKVLLTGFLLSLAIELLQLFGGRFAEIDDLIINTAGTMVGYGLYACVTGWKKNRKTSLVIAGVLCVALALGFTGLSFVCDDAPVPAMGLDAVETQLAEVNLYAHGEQKAIDTDTEVFFLLDSQLQSCGGHVLEAQPADPEPLPNNSDTYVEMQFSAPVTVTFSEEEGFTLSDIDRLLYNATQNILYYGSGDYQYRIDYAVFDQTLQDHSAEILEQYQDLAAAIEAAFR